MKKRIIALTLTVILVLACFAGCAQPAQPSTEPTGEPTQPSAEKIVRFGDLFANTYTSLDPAQGSCGWWTSDLGLTETLFVIDESFSVQPHLAKSAALEGSVWTIKLRDDVTFSDGSKLTAQTAVDCLKRVPTVNENAATLSQAVYEVLDETTFTITTPEPLATMTNELTSVYYSMVNLDATGDIDAAPVCTGPMVVKDFNPGVSTTMVKNENYWGGEVALTAAEGYYMADADTLSLAMQNGELNAMVGPTVNDLKVFGDDGDYTVTSVPSSRLYYYYLNLQRIPEKDLRAAVNMAINSEEICTMLEGLASPTVGPFNSEAPYGQVTKSGFDVEKAKSLIEGLGYTLNDGGYYEKDGAAIELNIAYYAARSIDKIVLLMQEQLKAVGIKTTLTVSDDPDGSYLTSHDFDIGMYCMIANPSADPYYFLNRVVGGGLYTSGGYDDAESQSLLKQLYSESDADKRAELANEIQQRIIDDEAMGFIAILNKITVTGKGVSGVSERNPISFYLVNAKTDVN